MGLLGVPLDNRNQLTHTGAINDRRILGAVSVPLRRKPAV